jgi:hypothetical protein
MRKIFDHPYRVVRWGTSGEMLDEVAQCINFTIADAAWASAKTIWPDDEITLQQGARIMKKGIGRQDA